MRHQRRQQQQKKSRGLLASQAPPPPAAPASTPAARLQLLGAPTTLMMMVVMMMSSGSLNLVAAQPPTGIAVAASPKSLCYNILPTLLYPVSSACSAYMTCSAATGKPVVRACGAGQNFNPLTYKCQKCAATLPPGMVPLGC